jgi:type II secretory ATPase GspE/PulE/Tfp pilus assembly ATPase PilB-like protein
MTFANVLRSVLRGDPDVIMVGEIRDQETALLAAGAAITGHLVLTTLHTNDAVGALTRLVDMGVEPFRVSAALTAVLSQRLVRRLCENCRESYEPSPEHLTAIGTAPGRQVTAFRAVGCDQCTAGYRGRVGVFELLQMTPELRELVAGGATRAELDEAGRRAGAEPLWVDGLCKAEAGTTSLEELKRVLG